MSITTRASATGVEGDRREPALRTRLVRSALFAAGFVGVYAFAVLTPQGQSLDQKSFGFPSWLESWIGDAAEPFGRLRTPVLLTTLALAALAILRALMRRRMRSAVSAIVVVGVVAAVCPLLRDDVLARPRLGIDSDYLANTFPSTHAALALTACVTIIALWGRPLPWWAVALIGGVLPLAVEVSAVAGFDHRASDVVGGVLLAGCATQWLVADDAEPIARWPSRSGPFLSAGVALLAVSAVVVSFGWMQGDGRDDFGLGFIALAAALIAVVLAVSPPYRRRAG